MPLSNVIGPLYEKDTNSLGVLGDGNIARRVFVANEAADAIPVYLAGSNGDKISVRGAISSLAASSLTTIQSYTVPVGKTLALKEIEVSGENAAEYTVEIDSTIEAKKRTYFTHYNTSFNWNDVRFSEGTVIDIRVIHQSDEVGDFDSRIIGELL